MIPLGLLCPGEQGDIVELREGKGHCHGQCRRNCGHGHGKHGSRMEDLGLRIGKRVEMLNNAGPILVRVDESRIAVDRGTAMKIMIRRQE
jgi:ferrous iron transport protein A